MVCKGEGISTQADTMSQLEFQGARSSRSQMFFKIVVLKIFCKFHRKVPVFESLFNKVAGLQILKFAHFLKEHLFYRTPPVAASGELR